MATVDLGKLKPVWKGTWAGSTSYEKDDMVQEGVNSYICTTAHTSDASTFSNDSANWDTMATGANIPTQTGNSGKVLKTDGSSLSWGDGLPTGGTNGQYITTDGTTASWGDVTVEDPGLKFLHYSQATNGTDFILSGDSIWGSNNDYYAHKIIFSFKPSQHTQMYARILDSNTNVHYTGNLYNWSTSMSSSGNGGPYVNYGEGTSEFRIDRDQIRGAVRTTFEMTIYNMRQQDIDAPIMYSGQYSTVNHDAVSRNQGVRFHGCMYTGETINARKLGWAFEPSYALTDARCWVYGYKNPQE